jgi:hypothetical protein
MPRDSKGYLAGFYSLDLLDLVPRLSLIVLLIDRVGNPSIHFAVMVLTVSGLVIPGLHRSRYLWLALAALAAYRVWESPHTVENHAWLLAYWCLALACSFSLRDAARSLATQGRLLIGGCMFFATLWKVVLSPDFMSGDFFHLTFLTDSRFVDFTLLASGGLTGAALESNVTRLEGLLDGQGPLRAVELATTGRLFLVARLASWWTALIEALLALQFLVPRGLPTRYRDWTLMLFAWTTYAIAPVMGFGWLLMVMGLAQSDPEHEKTRLLYLVSCFVVAGHRYLPWLEGLASWGQV